MKLLHLQSVIFESSPGYQTRPEVIDTLTTAVSETLLYIIRHIPDDDTTVREFMQSDEYKNHKPQFNRSYDFNSYLIDLSIVLGSSNKKSLTIGAETVASLGKSGRASRRNIGLTFFVNGSLKGSEVRKINTNHIRDDVESAITHEMIHVKSIDKKITKSLKMDAGSKYQKATSRDNLSKGLTPRQEKTYRANKEEVEARIAEIQLFVKKYLTRHKDENWTSEKLAKELPGIIRQTPEWKQNHKFWNDGVRKRILSKVINYAKEHLGYKMSKDGRRDDSVLLSRLLRFIRSNGNIVFIRNLKDRIEEAKQKSKWENASKETMKKWISDNGEKPTGDLVKQSERISLEKKLDELSKRAFPAFDTHFLSEDPVWRSMSGSPSKREVLFHRIFRNLMVKYL